MTPLFKFFNQKISLQFIKFAVVGVINTLLHLAILYVLVEYFSIYYVLASFIAFLIAVTNSFILNTIWTFNTNIRIDTKSKYIKFFVISSLALIINLSLLYLITEYLHIWYIASQISATFFSLLVNFLGNKFWTYREKIVL